MDESSFSHQLGEQERMEEECVKKKDAWLPSALLHSKLADFFCFEAAQQGALGRDACIYKGTYFLFKLLLQVTSYNNQPPSFTNPNKI